MTIAVDMGRKASKTNKQKNQTSVTFISERKHKVWVVS